MQKITTKKHQFLLSPATFTQIGCWSSTCWPTAMFFLLRFWSSLSLPFCCFFFIPSHLSLVSPSSLLFLTSCLPNLFSLMSMRPVSRSVYFVTVYLPSLSSLITHSPLVSPCLLPPLGGVSVPDRVQHRNHRFIKVSQCRFVRSLLNNCPGKGANNSTYRTWSAALTRSCFSLYTSAKQSLTVAQRV